MATTIDTAATAIAAALGEEWLAGEDQNPVSWLAIVSGPDGMRLSIRAAGTVAKGSLEITGGYPPSHVGIPNGTMPSIRCSAKRSAAAIATDVAKRLMPSYREAFMAQKRVADAAMERHQQMLAARDRIVAAVPGAMAYGEPRGGTFELYRRGDADGRPTIEAEGKLLDAERVSIFRLLCTVDQAVAVLQLLSGWEEGESAE